MRRPGEPPEDALDRFHAESFSPEARPLWRLWVEVDGLAGRDALLAKAMAEARQRLRDGLEAILSGGAAQGCWPLTSPRATAIRLEALRDGLVGLLLSSDPEMDAHAAEQHLRDAFRWETHALPQRR